MVKIGKIPFKEQRMSLPKRTNQMLRWFQYLYINKEFLYIQKPSSDGRAETSRVCISLDLQNELIAQAHKGHTGITDTLSKLRDRGYFPGMSQQVTLVRNNSLSCLQKNNIDLKRMDINKFNRCSNIDYYLQ